MSEILQPVPSDSQTFRGQAIDVEDQSIAAPRIEIPGLVIDHLDHSPESMNAAIDELFEEANRRSKYGGPEDLYHEYELPNDRQVVFEICTEDAVENNGSRDVYSIELKFRNAEGTGFEYWLTESGLVFMFDKPNGSEETRDLFNNYHGGDREYEDWVSEDMQEHAASAVAGMRAMMDRATMGFPTTLWHKN